MRRAGTRALTAAFGWDDVWQFPSFGLSLTHEGFRVRSVPELRPQSLRNESGSSPLSCPATRVRRNDPRVHDSTRALLREAVPDQNGLALATRSTALACESIFGYAARLSISARG